MVAFIENGFSWVDKIEAILIEGIFISKSSSISDKIELFISHLIFVIIESLL
ncbi:MAG: hypothetical protein LBQ24_00745 [Candidatus Peribacteria bacterium]|nr:hypothetical protein [Candidatus Peribacteria bacterium]